jgi:hypothetical protein
MLGNRAFRTLFPAFRRTALAFARAKADSHGINFTGAFDAVFYLSSLFVPPLFAILV